MRDSVGRSQTEAVEAGALEQAELPDRLVHVREMEYAYLGQPVEVVEGEAGDSLEQLRPQLR